jgi:hypothetical protein
MHWGHTSKEFQDLEATKQWTKGVVAWLMKNEIKRVREQSKGDAKQIEQAGKAFLPLSGPTFGALSTKPAAKAKITQRNASH